MTAMQKANKRLEEAGIGAKVTTANIFCHCATHGRHKWAIYTLITFVDPDPVICTCDTSSELTKAVDEIIAGTLKLRP